ncbi:hypothetical protein HY522_02735 [bacterium]|nr:hypothetical protein [bacterium]
MSVRYNPAGRAGLTLDVTGARIPADRRNTVYRAWEFLRRRFPPARRGAFAVILRKRIPSGSGLGGASADAAAFLSASARLLGENLPAGPAFLSRVSREIGADVPFCLRGAAAVGRGRGERLTPIRPLPRRRVIIAVPRKKILTRAAYLALDRARPKNLTFSAGVHTLDWVVDAVRKSHAVEFPLNDFQVPACRSHPELARIAAVFSREGFSGMTGSGSAFFALPVRPGALSRLKAALPGVRILESVFVSRGYDGGSIGGAD